MSTNNNRENGSFRRPRRGSLKNDLYYYNARFYDPNLGVFTSADSIVPGGGEVMSIQKDLAGVMSPGDRKSFTPENMISMAANRYMYVAGNPIMFSDPSGHGWWSKFKKAVGKAVAFAVTVIAAPIILIGTVVTVANGGDINDFYDSSYTNTVINVARGVAMATAALALGVLMCNPISAAIVGAVVGGITASMSGGNIWDGMASGALNGFVNGILAPVFLTGSVTSAFFAGYYDIYSHDKLGALAFISDSTISMGMTAIGAGKMILELLGGADFQAGLSKQSNAFIFTDSIFPRSNSIGNVVSISKKDTAKGIGSPDFNRVLREELLHNWQYRSGGLVAGIALWHEQTTSNPYTDPDNYEYKASHRAKYQQKDVWELQCSTCARFYP